MFFLSNVLQIKNKQLYIVMNLCVDDLFYMHVNS